MAKKKKSGGAFPFTYGNRKGNKLIKFETKSLPWKKWILTPFTIIIGP